MDSKLQALKRAAKQGDTEDKARFLATLVKSGGLPRKKVQLASMLKAPEARLLEASDYGDDADWSTLMYVALDNMENAEIADFARQLVKDNFWLDENAKKALQEDRLMHWREANNVQAVLPPIESFLFRVWRLHKNNHPVAAWYLNRSRLVDYLNRQNIASPSGLAVPQKLANFLMYGNIHGP